MFLGYKLKKLRAIMGWSPKQLQALTGLSLSSITELESGKTKNPRPITVEKLCKGTNMEKEYFYSDNVKLPRDVFPDMPERIEKFIMSDKSLPYLAISEKAAEHKIPPEILENLIDLWIKKDQ
jgi:transcriptional regulator with XRE-family HTH domain